MAMLNGNQLSAEQLRNLCLRYERELRGAKDWMFWFLMVWTFVLLVMEWADFLFQRAVPTSIGAGYTILLGSYVAHKEVLRWTGVVMRVRPGEFFVYVWWGMLLAMFLFEYFFGRFVVPEGMLLLAYEVLGYFIATELSKSLNAWRTVKKNGLVKEKTAETR